MIKSSVLEGYVGGYFEHEELCVELRRQLAYMVEGNIRVLSGAKTDTVWNEAASPLGRLRASAERAEVQFNAWKKERDEFLAIPRRNADDTRACTQCGQPFGIGGRIIYSIRSQNAGRPFGLFDELHRVEILCETCHATHSTKFNAE